MLLFADSFGQISSDDEKPVKASIPGTCTSPLNPWNDVCSQYLCLYHVAGSIQSIKAPKKEVVSIFLPGMFISNILKRTENPFSSR